MTASYPKLFAPLAVGRVTLQNRIVFASHLTNFATDGLPTDQHAAYYEARARGGAGLIITEEQATHPSDHPYEKMIQGYLPEAIGGYRKITDAVHRHGAVVLAQVNHNGGQGTGMYSRRALLAPSAIPDPLFREVPKAVDSADIAELIDGFVTVARHCRLGGFDGVELQCSQSSIIRSFLARATNRRTDLYGGSLERRARFLLEVIDAVRDSIGPDLILGVRLAGAEYIEDGIVIDEAIDTAKLVDATGAVDYINTAIGVATSTLHLIEASMATPRGYANFIPSSIRPYTTLPVIGVGRFTDPVHAEQALAEGLCDLIGVVRGQIADPDFVNKARMGEASQIRTCMSCNQECIGRVGANRWIGCAENARAGKEAVSIPIRSGPPQRVLVVGGGPGGLQAASTAAQSGHEVILIERSDQLGGQVRTAAVVPGRAEFFGVVSALVAECSRYGVRIQRGIEVTASMVREGNYDAVIVATGARPSRPRWACMSNRIVDVRDVLEGRCSPSGSVLVVDELGFHQGTSTAEWLADHGCSVAICTSGMVVGQDLGVTLDMEGWQKRASDKHIEQVIDVVPMSTEVAPDGRIEVTLLHHPSGALEQHSFDWVVCSVHQKPVDELWKQLRGGRFALTRIGDAVTPRRLHSAVIEGARVDSLAGMA